MQTKRVRFPKITIGVDLGDRQSVICEIDRKGAVVGRSTIRTAKASVREYFAGRERSRVVLEAGTHSPWFAREVRGARP